MKSIYLFLLIFSTIIIPLSKLQSQPDTVWTKRFDDVSELANFQLTSDGGYIICGGKVSTRSPYLIKTDSMGDTVWTSQLDSSIVGAFNSVQQTSDGGYILGGNGRWIDGAMLIKTDTRGDTIWTKFFRNSDLTYSTRVIQTSDGGFLVMSMTNFPQSRVWLLRTDSNGDSLWSKIYGNSQFNNYCTAALQLSDGNFIFCGLTDEYYGLYKGWVVKLNHLGDTLWTRKYQSSISSSDAIDNVTETVDGGYVFSGFSQINHGYQPLLIKTGQKGHTLWIKNYDFGNDNTIFSHGITIDNEIVAAGFRHYGDSTSLFLMKTDNVGDIKWTKTVPGIHLSSSITVRIASNKEFTVLCPDSNFKAWLLKFSEIITDVKAQTEKNITSSYNLQQNYPNPFNPITTIKFDLPKSSDVTLKIFNIIGEEVGTLASNRLSAGSYKYEWDASTLASGVYLYRLQAYDYVETRKMILMK